MHGHREDRTNASTVKSAAALPLKQQRHSATNAKSPNNAKRSMHPTDATQKRERRDNADTPNAYTVRRTFAALALLILALAVIREFYVSVFNAPGSVGIERDIALLASRVNNDVGDYESTAGDRRDEIARRLRRRLGAGIDSLPTVRFAAAPQSGPHAESAEEKQRRAIEQELWDRKQACLTTEVYLGPEDEYVDCESYCAMTDGVTYRYVTRTDRLLNGRLNHGRGAYCLPTEAARCNEHTALTIYGMHSWRCMPQTRAFSGDGGNQIVACNGSLLDRATGRVWRGHIDPSLTFDSIDEFLPDVLPDDARRGLRCSYRFVCPPDDGDGARDDRGNLRVEAPFDRLFRLANTCASLIPHATDDVKPDFATGRCECGEFARYEEQLRTCAPIGHGETSRDPIDPFDRRTLEMRVNPRLTTGAPSEACIEPWMTLSQARSIRDLATDATSAASSAAAHSGDYAPWLVRQLLPQAMMCGEEKTNSGSGYTQPGYRRTRALIFDRHVPSPQAMLQSSPSLASL